MFVLIARRYPRITGVWERHKEHAPLAALVWGFIWDSLTLSRPDRVFDNAVMLAYILLAGFCIILVHAKGHESTIGRIPLLIIIQFAFGNLAGALFVLYGKSGTFAGSALFFLIFGAFAIGNELLRKQYEQSRFHISAYYLLVLAYMALIIPVVVRAIGPAVFALSTIAALLYITLFVALLRLFLPKKFAVRISDIAFWIWGITIGFVVLYAANIIPPVPLALSNIGVYHTVLKENGSYILAYEASPWYSLWRDTNYTYRRGEGEGAYCWSAIFAPAGLRTDIVHEWERYDGARNRWIVETKVTFPIQGGRDLGYRGYSKKNTLKDGIWRCSVKTPRGQLLGRISFAVLSGKATLAERTF